MKKLFTILAVAATLVSCAKEDVVREAAREAIGFDNAFVENSTRSVETPGYSSASLFNDFAVYGFVEGATLFNGVKVAKDGTVTNGDLTEAWKYAGTQYWIAGANYDFYAVAPFNGGWSVKTGTTPASTGAVITFTNENGTQDLLYTGIVAQEGKVSGNAAVAFNFKHILSKVKFSFENGYNASNATIKVYDVKIENAYETATATLGVNSTAWANHADTLELEFGNASDNEATTDVKESAEVAYAYGATYESLNERFLIPDTAPEVTYEVKDAEGNKSNVTANAYKVTFKVDLLVSDKKIATYNHTAYAQFAPVAGNSYDIKTVINAANIDPEHSQEPIEFTATMTDWSTAEDETATVVTK